MKEFLSRAGVPYEAYDVDEDERAYDELLSIGYRAVPVIVIGERILSGYDPDALAAAIAEYRARS